MIDITPHSLGIGALDDISYMSTMSLSALFGGPEEQDHDIKKEIDLVASRILSKNTPVPVRKNRKFSEPTLFQKAYRIQVYQGEKDRFGENKMIGEVLFEVKDPQEESNYLA